LHLKAKATGATRGGDLLIISGHDRDGLRRISLSCRSYCARAIREVPIVSLVPNLIRSQGAPRAMRREGLPRTLRSCRSFCPNAVLTARFRRQEFRLPPATAPPAAAAAAAAPAASPAAPATAAAVTPSNFLAQLRLCGILFVEDVKRRQADVRDFLVSEKDFMI